MPDRQRFSLRSTPPTLLCFVNWNFGVLKVGIFVNHVRQPAICTQEKGVCKQKGNFVESEFRVGSMFSWVDGL